MEKRSLVNKLLEFEYKRDWDGLGNLFTDDVVYEVIGYTKYIGKNEVRIGFEKDYADLYEWKGEIVRSWEDENSLVCEFVCKGLYKAFGKEEKIPVCVRTVCIYEIRDNKISHITEYWSDKEFDVQIGEG